jgi:broad specificity phosphatase PhoE
MKKILPWSVVLLMLAAFAGLIFLYMFSPVTRVIVVRHAERSNDTDTTSISAAGWERAAALAAAVSDADVQRIFVTEKIRTGQTAARAAELLSIVPSVIPSDRTSQLIDSIRAHSGETILVVGHANTIPAILASLDAYNSVTIPRDVYDDLFVVTVTPFRSSLIRLKYGRRS